MRAPQVGQCIPGESVTRNLPPVRTDEYAYGGTLRVDVASERELCQIRLYIIVPSLA